MDALAADLPKIISVFGLAFVSFWGAIPVGLAMGVAPLAVIVSTTLSYACGVALVLVFGERARRWLSRRRGSPPPTKAEATPGKLRQRVQHITKRYGAFGLGVAAPLTLGSQIGAALGMALNLPPRRLFIAMSAGGLLWSILLTLLTLFGAAGVQAVR
jgi:uncharacterized membrane protein